MRYAVKVEASGIRISRKKTLEFNTKTQAKVFVKSLDKKAFTCIEILRDNVLISKLK